MVKADIRNPPGKSKIDESELALSYWTPEGLAVDLPEHDNGERFRLPRLRPH
jgi:hypothetical protein